MAGRPPATVSQSTDIGSPSNGELLQPPLEVLLAADALHFPHAPFPFQLDGVAFLFARREAVLADEMGLGKTMQAITTIRLLAKHGKVRRVLLVCPKPVVTSDGHRTNVIPEQQEAANDMKK